MCVCIAYVYESLSTFVAVHEPGTTIQFNSICNWQNGMKSIQAIVLPLPTIIFCATKSRFSFCLH